jgi:hypothetical protein
MIAIPVFDAHPDHPFSIRQGSRGVQLTLARPMAPTDIMDLSPEEAQELAAALQVHAVIARERVGGRK